MASTKITDYLAQGLAAARPAIPANYTGTISWYYATDTGALTYYANGAWNGAGSPFDANADSIYFGNGSDGTVTVSAPTTRLSRDMYYANLTINGTGRINTNGFRIFVSGILDITAAPANAIVHYNATDGVLDGGSTASFAQGSGGSAPAAGSIGGAAAGGIGAAGVIGATTGAQGAASSTLSTNLTTKSGNSGKGGTGNAGVVAGGALRAGTTATKSIDILRLCVDFFIMTSATVIGQVQGGAAAPGGSAGAGDGANHGGGGAGGGAGGGMVFVAARTINRGAGTAVAAIHANGGNGGNAGPSDATGNAGGGGGGGGASGGWLYVIYRLLTGVAATNCLSARGGNGGNGGAGHGTGIGGDGGDAGSRGRLSIFNLATGGSTFADSDSTTVAGTAGSGTVAGTGGTANTQQATL